ncbi:MAG: anion permease, partial [Candidatus Riflebacteria bacterium]|nr:anion permease [Candidatus Riflebacteria bacterium]
RLGPLTPAEWRTLAIVLAIVGALFVSSTVPVLDRLDKSALILVSTVLFFVFDVLTIKDLEEMPWNLILLFGGTASLGFCLWETGASMWLAVKLVALLEGVHWPLFVIGASLFVLLVTNCVLNVAVIAIALPVALVLARYVGVAPEVVFFPCLACAGMPFLLVGGAAPNAIAYESKQFSTREFLGAGALASVLLLLILAVFVRWIWPLLYRMPLFPGGS